MKTILLSAVFLMFIENINFNNIRFDIDMKQLNSNDSTKQETAVFGSGCFWCGEAVFERVKGVKSVISGYAGGNTENPSYLDVSTGATGHAEVYKIIYDPSIISYRELLEIFWKTHDPTTLNRQGADIGTQYRSIILYADEDQKKMAEYYKKKLEDEHIYDNPIVTEIVPLKKFFSAEDYHQDYYEKNPTRGYCSFVITPKLEKFKKIFKDKLKSVH